MKTNSLGNREIKFLSWAQNRGKTVVRTGDARAALKISKIQEAKIFYSLKKRGLITQVMRGLYLVPSMLPPGGKAAPSQYVVLDTLMKEVEAKAFQVTGWLVFNSYHLDTQVPIRMDVYNDKLSGEKTIGGQNFRFIKVAQSRLGYTKDFPVEDVTAHFSSLPRAVFDAIYDYERFGSLPMAYEWLKERVKDRKFMTEFLEICLKLANVSTLRRVGYTLEEAGCAREDVSQLLKRLKKTSSFIQLDPRRPKRGRTNSKWGIVIND
jgi:predicted transcriptional regulator of viral defense system